MRKGGKRRGRKDRRGEERGEKRKKKTPVLGKRIRNILVHFLKFSEVQLTALFRKRKNWADHFSGALIIEPQNVYSKIIAKFWIRNTYYSSL